MKRRTIFLLAAISLAVYTPGVTWGTPHATDEERIKPWGVDDESPMGPLAEISHIVFGPAPDRNLGYPMMHPFTVAVAYAPYLGLLIATGDMSSPGGDYPYGFSDPVRTLHVLTVIAHLVSVLFAVLAVLAAYAAGTFLWDERTGVVAAAFTLTSYPMFYYGRTANPDAMQVGFMALCLASFAYWVMHPRQLKGMLGIGVFGGFALATKEPIAAAFIPIAPVVLVIQWQTLRGEASAVSWKFWKPPVLGVLALFLAFGIGSGLFVDPERFFAHIDFIGSRLGEARAGEVPFLKRFPETFAGSIALARHLGGYIVDSMTWPGVLLALLGVGWALRTSPRSVLLVLPVLTYLFVLFTSVRSGFLRYLMPAVFPLGLFAARAAVLGWRSERPALRWGVGAMAAVALGLGALRGLDLTHAMLHDSRYTAGEWFADHAPDGARLEYFGPTQKLPHLPASMAIRRSTPYLGGSVSHPRDAETAARIAAGWVERRPDYIVVIPDYTSGEAGVHSNSHPPDAYAGLIDGRYGYELGAEFETPALLPWVRRPLLDYWLVNPRIQVFTPSSSPPGA